MKKTVPFFAFIMTLLFLGFSGCSGEAGILNNSNNSNNDAGPDGDGGDCPVQNVCGVNCCTDEQECIFGTCEPICPQERCRGVCCGEGEECVNNMQCLPVCETLRCGENLVDCCNAGQICLDGVQCAADCGTNNPLCGENLDICCPFGRLCLNNECVQPGSFCMDNYDCPSDEWYCELNMNICLPLPEGVLCQGEPNFTAIEPVLEWYWRGTSYLGKEYTDSMASPIIGDVNGDGIPDVVVVLFHLNLYDSDSIIVVLNGAGDGAGGGEILFTIPSDQDPTAPKPFGGASVALANFDDDPGLEIVYNVQGGGVRIADNDGIGDVCDRNLYPSCTGARFSGGSMRHIHGGPSVADVDHDGIPDVIIACHVMNGRDISNPALDFVNSSECGKNTAIADLNTDGKLEVVDAAHAITIDPAVLGGVPFWTTNNAVSSSFVAVADIIPDISGPEVVNIYNNFYLMDGQTGQVLIGPGGTLADVTVPIPGTGNGGAPTVADFDGDGLPEISTAGRAAYVVYDPDCYDPPLRTGGLCNSGRTDLILWETPTQDLSSSMTGSSVFDFQGDGAAEVLYNDECFFHIYDGLTGAELVSPMIPSSTGTLAEYPLVADVDGDGNAEMIIVSNKYAVTYLNCRAAWKAAGIPAETLCALTDCTPGDPCAGGPGGTCTGDYVCDAAGTCQYPGGTMGVRVYGDANDRWVRTRPVWNQFNYHVTNISFASGLWDVPLYEEHSWLTYNNYRQNVQGGALFPVPDLMATLQAAARCPDTVNLSAVIFNNGSAGAATGATVSFYRTDVDPPELIETVLTTGIILPGGWERVNTVYENVETGVDMTFTAVVNEGAVLEECSDSNNSSSAGPIMCTNIE